MTVRCPGIVSTDTNGVAICTDTGGAPLAWEQIPAFQLSDIDPVQAGELWTLGFALYATAWVIGKATGLLLQMIKEAW